jgi:adenylate cyclase
VFQLVYRIGSEDITYRIEKDETVIGRSPQADVVLTHFGVSRFHARLTRQKDQFLIKDLESRNGTRVNGIPVKEGLVSAGDRITLGEFVLDLRRLSDERVVISDEKGFEQEEGTVIRPLDEIEKYLGESQVLAVPQPRAETGSVLEAPRKKEVVDHAERSSKIWMTLTQVAKTLISTDRLEEILDKVMDLVFTHVPAERGVIGLYEGEGRGVLQPKIVRHRQKDVENDEIVISKTITERAREDKVAILTSDAMVDPRFAGGHSIMLLGIRSAMCVPLWNKDNVIGIIYVDNAIQAGSFTPFDLDLLTALANYAAVGIERAMLNKKIQEERAARSKLERYHAPGIVESILKSTNEQSLVVQERNVSVCFTDLVGFTSMSESLEPQQVALLLSEFFTEMVDIIFKHEGTLDKYIGDCIMSIFGAPIPQPDHALRAVRTALEMHEALREMNVRRTDGFQFEVRTAINSGKVVAGDVGCMRRMDYSVLGDTVNTAARLEKIGQPGQIVIGEETYLTVKDQFVIEHIGTYSLKGRKKKMNAYCVIGPNSRNQEN